MVRIGRAAGVMPAGRRTGRRMGPATLVGLLLVVGLATGASAQDPSASAEPRLLFFQEFQSGTLVPAAQGAGVTITLNGGTSETAFVTNWPGRMAGVVETQDILTAVAASVNSPPVAVIVSDIPDGTQATYTVQILGAQQPSADQIVYDAWLIDPSASDAFPLESPAPPPTAQVDLGLTHVFIDGLAGMCMRC